MEDRSLPLEKVYKKGTRARARINFGGIVAAGVPGFAPDAGKWGFGEEGKTDGRFHSIYGANLSGGDTYFNTYHPYVPSSDVDDATVGTQTLYGLKMVDHRGKSHIIRYVYRRAGESFSHKNSVMPKTIDEEIMIHFDDRDIAQGGFTIGANMWGQGPAGTPFYYTGSDENNEWKGNTWRGVHTPNVGYAVTIDTDTTVKSSGTYTNPNTLILDNGSGVGYYNTGIWHDVPDVDDVLGWMGFPKTNGLIWLAIPSAHNQYGDVGVVFRYSYRTAVGRTTQQKFYGLEGVDADDMDNWFVGAAYMGPTSVSNQNAPVIISPHLNQTTIVTDELIAAATAFAFSVDPNEEDQYFDCSDLRAPDGRKYSEILGDNAATAIKITTFNTKKKSLR